MTDQTVTRDWPRWSDAPPAIEPEAPRPLLRRLPRNHFCYGLVKGRLSELRTFTLDQCRDVLALDDSGAIYLQVSVRRALDARVKRLEGEAAA